MQQITWLEHIQALQEKLNEFSTPFVELFRRRLEKAIEHFIQKQSLLPLSSQQETSEQKAFVHALQLYDAPSLLKLIANYDASQPLAKGGLGAVQKSIHSLKVLPHLEKLTVTPMEREALFSYMRQLKTHLAFAFSCSLEELADSQKQQTLLQQFSEKPEWVPAQAQPFVAKQLDLLFSSEYQIYLMVKNRYFLNYLLQKGEDYPLADWLHILLDEIHVPARKDLATRLTSLNFRTMECLVQLMLQPTMPADRLPEFSSLLLPEMLEEERFLGNISMPERPSLGVLERLQDIENIPIAPPLAQESQGELPLASLAPRSPLQRSPFERLCLQYVKELLYLANHTELVTECSSPYFRSKVEEYVSAHERFFANFFSPHPKILEEFGHFMGQLLEKTQVANRFKSQQEEIGVYAWQEGQWQIAEMQKRVKEWSVLLKSQLPFSINMASGGETLSVAKGRQFIIQFGRTYFDYDRPKPEWFRTSPTGYFKILLKGSQVLKDSAVIYSGNSPYYKLTDAQLQQWRGLILLYFIVIRNKYSVELSPSLEDYLVEMLPALMKSGV